MTGSLKIDVREIKAKGRALLRESLPASDYQESVATHATLLGPLSVELDLEVRGGEVQVRGRASGRWELECCRCLSRQAFAYDAQVEGAAPATAETLDASEDVRQALVLALPMKATCRPDCKGLCVQCGADKNLNDCGCNDGARL